VLEYVSPAYATIWGRSVESLERAGQLAGCRAHRRPRPCRDAVARLQDEPHYDAEFRIELPDGAALGARPPVPGAQRATRSTAWRA
jgi:PAS domain-containing protein